MDELAGRLGYAAVMEDRLGVVMRSLVVVFSY